MKKIILFISLYLFSFHVYSSTEETQDIRQWLEKMFEHLDNAALPAQFHVFYRSFFYRRERIE